MTHPSGLTFGKMQEFGELARGVHPLDEAGLAMALALGQPDDPAPPFATIEVILDGHAIGFASSIRWVWGDQSYRFRSLSGKTEFYCSTKEGLVSLLQIRLGLASVAAT